LIIYNIRQAYKLRKCNVLLWGIGEKGQSGLVQCSLVFVTVLVGVVRWEEGKEHDSSHLYTCDTAM
jgi:hypothetical protein